VRWRTASNGTEGLLSQRTEPNPNEGAMSAPPDKAVEHKQIIAFLAKESTASLDEVTRLYDHERAGLEASSRIKRFLPIITIRNVRAALRQSRVKAGTIRVPG
jgi:hypothetical protein